MRRHGASPLVCYRRRRHRQLAEDPVGGQERRSVRRRDAARGMAEGEAAAAVLLARSPSHDVDESMTRRVDGRRGGGTLLRDPAASRWQTLDDLLWATRISNVRALAAIIRAP